MKKLFLLIISFVFLHSVFAAQYGSFVYPSENVDLTFDDSYFTLQINTINETICRYSSSSGINFSLMNDFSSGYSKIHKRDFFDMSDGVHRIYVKCLEGGSYFGEPNESRVNFYVNSLVSAEISLSKGSPINSGTVDVEIKTSRAVSSYPSVLYSFNEKDYKELSLTGSVNDFSGYIIIPDSLGEGVLSFKFSAKDLEGRTGNKISGRSVFEFDTIAPSRIDDFKINSYEDKIKLTWNTDEVCSEFKIYKSDSSGVDINDYFKSTNKRELVDYSVSSDDVYYYRVSCVDEANNVGELSKELYARVDSEDYSENGLSPTLLPRVDSLLSEINRLNYEVEELIEDFSSKTGDEKYFSEILGITSSLNSAKSKLLEIKSSAESLKSQSLDEKKLGEEIGKIELRVVAVEKSIIKSIEIVSSEEYSETLSEKNIMNALKKENSFMTEKEMENRVENSIKLADENNLAIKSNFYLIRTSYFDGRDKEYSFVVRNYDSVFELQQNAYFVESFPETLSLYLSDVVISNRNYDLSLDKSGIYFGVDTKKVVYYVDENIFAKLKEISPSFVYLGDSSDGSVGITGFFVFSSDEINYSIGVLIVLILAAVYFVYLRKKKSLSEFPEVASIIKKIRSAIDSDDLSSARKQYEKLNEIYSSMSKRDKKRVFYYVEEIRVSVISKLLKQGLVLFSKTKSSESFSKLEKLSREFPLDIQRKIRKQLSSLRGEIEK